MKAIAQEVDAAVSVLKSGHFAIAAKDWPGGGLEIGRPGLYSWWTSKAGAAALSSGLGVEIAAGLIYAGQAGASRWPSGKRFDQTLHGRIGKNHITGTIGQSTLRRTLAACLVSALDLRLMVGTKPTLALNGERHLTEWIRAQMSVVLFPFDDRDRLASLEERVLQVLDPPLNLDGMTVSPARASLGKLRVQAKLDTGSDAPLPLVPKFRQAARKPRALPGSVTLHEEVTDILRESGDEWMTTTEIAHLVNQRGRYTKRDGSAVTTFQIHGRTRNYPDLFERAGSRVRLIG